MEVFPKFIIEEDKLILRKATYHKEIATDITKVKGGGWFRYLHATDMFVFYGSSYDFGKATFENIKQCVESGEVYTGHRNISTKHNFGYDTGIEIIELKTKGSN